MSSSVSTAGSTAPSSTSVSTAAFTTKLRKFDGTGYRVWARQLQLYLEVKDVWEAVLKPAPTVGQLSAEGSGTGDRPLHQLAVRQKLAMTIILAALTDEQAAVVADLEHPQQMLMALQKTYRHVCDTTVGALKREYMSLYIDVGGDMLEHIRQTRLMLADLACYKVSLTDGEKKSNFLQSLGPDWNGYVGSLEACSTFEEMLIKAAGEARRRSTQAQRGKRGGGSMVRSGNAFAAKHDGKKKGKCFNCGKRGHFKNECRAPKRRVDGMSGSGAGRRNNDSAESGFAFQVSERAAVEWIIDSGASSHMTGRKELLTGLRDMSHPIVVTTASGMTLNATQRGKARLPLVDGGACTLENVLYVPGLQRNLVSLSKAGTAGLHATFDQDRCTISCGNSRLVADRRDSGLYVVTSPVSGAWAEANAATSDRDLSLWHNRLGHLNTRDLKKVLRGCGIHVANSEIPPCDACAAGKLARLPFPSKKPRDLKRGQVLIAIDYVGPMETTSHDGFTGMVNIMIEPYHLTAVFPVKDKSSATQLSAVRDCIANLKVAVSNASVAVLKSDNAAEYVGGEIADFCNKHMIAQEFSTPYSPQQNGKVERSNRVIVEMARAMLQAAGLGKRFWSDAVLAAAYIRNRCPSKVLGGKTPLERLTGRAPSLKNLRTFGCSAQVLLPKSQRQKLDAKTTKGIFLGYDKAGGYRFWVPSGYGGSGSVITALTAVFFESKMAKDNLVTMDADVPIITEVQGATPNEAVTESPTPMQVDEQGKQLPAERNEPRQEKQMVRRSKRVSKKSVRRLEFEESHNNTESALVTTMQDPLTLQEAMSRPDAEQWRHAMNEELDSLRRNGTYEEMFPPSNVRPVKTKWVFRRKTFADGSLDKYKARLVAKGFTQQFGVDYSETFSPVVRHESIRTVLALAVQLGWYHLQLDVQTAFLNSDLTEDIYVIPPTEGSDEAKVWKLKKALYGLKQASRAWYETVTRYLLEIGFQQCQSDTCVLVKRNANSIVVILLYVDDMLIFSDKQLELSNFETGITEKFAINTCGSANCFVGMELSWSEDRSTLIISQRKYSESVVQRFGNTGEKHLPRTPMDAEFQRRLASDDILVDDSHRPVIGALLYAATISRPDLSTSVRILAQECEHPTATVRDGIQRVMGYLKRTRSIGLQYQRSRESNQLLLEVYCDAAFACERERKSTSGFAVFLNGCCIAWGSKKQPIVTLSTTESEYVALTHGTKECIGLKRLLVELGMDVGKIIVYEDNQAAQHLAEGKGVAQRSKHIDLRYHWIRKQIKNETVELHYCPTASMVADHFTKPLAQHKFETFIYTLRMCRVGVSGQVAPHLS